MVLAGRPERFCAGFDLRVMMSGPEHAKRAAHARLRAADAALRRAVPLVIACTGHALAGGALVVLTGDRPDRRAGRVQASGSTRCRSACRCPVLAMELARDRLRRRRAAARDADGADLRPRGARCAPATSTRSSPPGEVLARAKAEAARLGALARSAYRATKTRLRGKTIAHIRRRSTRTCAT